MPPTTCENLRTLATDYLPVIRYADSERAFPVLAESWLTHTSAAPWEAAAAEEDDLPADPARRGTALVRASADLSTLTQLGGAPNPHDRPIQLRSSNTDPDAIGNDAYKSVGPDVFLDFAGWAPDSNRRRGDDDYLAAAYSELAAAINPTQTWRLIEWRPNLPHSWIPQPVTPTVYVEAEWGGMFQQWNDRYGQKDFAPLPANTSSPLDAFLVLTYFYLYPFREPAPNEAGPRKLEGQWGAVSLFFSGTPDPARDGGGRCVSFDYAGAPSFIAISKGLERSMPVGMPLHRSEVRAWNTIERQGTHPVLYVGAGTHRHFFEPVQGSRWDPATDVRVRTGTGDDTGPEFPGIEMILVWGFALALVLLILGLIVAAMIVAAIALLLWLISLLIDALNQGSGDPLPAGQDNDEAPGDGPQAGGASEPPAGASATPGSTTAPGTSNAGSPTGRSTVDFDVRIVDMFNEADTETDFPSASACEHPHWWDYSGGWGINVAPAVDNDWESGTQRIDAQQRSWAYWHGLRLQTFLVGGSPGP